jgi:hypothetical protein
MHVTHGLSKIPFTTDFIHSLCHPKQHVLEPIEHITPIWLDGLKSGFVGF